MYPAREPYFRNRADGQAARERVRDLAGCNIANMPPTLAYGSARPIGQARHYSPARMFDAPRIFAASDAAKYLRHLRPEVSIPRKLPNNIALPFQSPALLYIHRLPLALARFARSYNFLMKSQCCWTLMLEQ